MASTRTPNKGDTVKLKSGGPKMSHCGFNNNGGAIVKWIFNGEIREAIVANEALVGVDDEVTGSPASDDF